MAMVARFGIAVFRKRFVGYGCAGGQAILNTMPYRGADGVGSGCRLAVGCESERGGQGRKKHQYDQRLAREAT